jgi:hypothetical protein
MSSLSPPPDDHLLVCWASDAHGEKNIEKCDIEAKTDAALGGG